MARTEARVKKQRKVDKNTIIFTGECNPRRSDVNAIVKIYQHILQNKTVLKELFPTNSFVVANKRTKNIHGLVAPADPCNIKTVLLDQTDHGYKKFEHKFDSKKTWFVCFATGTKYKIRRGSTCNTKSVLYT